MNKEIENGANKNEGADEMEEGSEAFNAVGNSNLGPHKVRSTLMEHFNIRRELRRLGLRKGMRYEPERLVKK